MSTTSASPRTASGSRTISSNRFTRPLRWNQASREIGRGIRIGSLGRPGFVPDRPFLLSYAPPYEKRLKILSKRNPSSCEWRRCAAPFLLKKHAGKENCFSVLKPAAVSDKIDRTSLNRGARCLDAKQRLSAFKAEIVKKGTIPGTGFFMAFCADSVSCGDQYETALCGRRARHVRGGCGYLNVS